MPQTMLFVTLAEPERVCMPPPPYPPLAEFPVIVQLMTVAPKMPLATPPPSRLELPEIVQPISVGIQGVTPTHFTFFIVPSVSTRRAIGRSCHVCRVPAASRSRKRETFAPCRKPSAISLAERSEDTCLRESPCEAKCEMCRCDPRCCDPRNSNSPFPRQSAGAKIAMAPFSDLSVKIL